MTEAGCFETVRSDRDALNGAIEETLRYRSPVRTASRYATTKTDVGGVTVEPGDKLCVWFAAANRDPTVFDTPGQYPSLAKRETT
ncbi:cytochrome P450 [Natrarchaeobius oligotrophus]|uniref:Cytochrome P450 n=1 Tax=Natrarchaeobius chitinivorans TaxID=1679083 RepID=A0A3N6MGM9_NATCH|nr:cytochrome P450 [Natrarchaeobius chitinivorans]RQG94791.1 cytochrome P450 [Natrarchaeobius chitinivorans]